MKMSSERLNWTFNTVPELYEKYRHCYVDRIYNDIFLYKPVDESCKLIEVGIGTGIATLPFLKTGAQVTAIEYGDSLSEFCRTKFKEYPNFDVKTLNFEDYECADNSVDLVYSASAFHWIPEEVGYSKVYSMLKPGGVFARFANHPFPDKSRPELSPAIQDVYKTYAPHRGGKYAPPVEYTEQDAKNRAMIAEKYGFKDITYKVYHSTRTFTAEQYIGLLGTYSDNIAMEENVRRAFFGEIKQAISNHGNKITVYDTMDLQLARK